MELYYALLRDYGKQIAEKYFIDWNKFCILIPREIIKEAMQFKLENKKENLSYVDCMGYIFALQNGILFLTGDSKFKDRKGVDWVK